MVKVRNEQLDKETIDLLNELLEKELSAVSAFKLMKIVKELDQIVKDKQVAEVNLIKKYATKDADGNVIQDDETGSFQIPDANVEVFNKEISDLMKFENELQHEALSIGQLGVDKISASKLLRIDFLLTD